ncbi:tolerance to colicin E2 [Oceanobacillus picturae]|uniref:Tolerance to colicin E2 n=1 Tax=Oceanobacillus picturae TaxID=171693 RepID=A0A0U9HF04_9BACI|nr:tolerance to colicin E2 [Oceanobacillus picturae]
MFENYIWLPIFVFIFVTVQQLIINNEIHWVPNILFSVFLYLFYVIWEWSKKPYDWNKK